MLVLVGFAIHISNVSVLANLLPGTRQDVSSREEAGINGKSNVDSNDDQCSLAFDHWMEKYYKTKVGALHVWSWRITPMISSVLLMQVIFALKTVITAVFIYATVMREESVPHLEKTNIVMRLVLPDFSWAVMWLLTLLLTLLLIASVSTRYKRLSLLVLFQFTVASGWTISTYPKAQCSIHTMRCASATGSCARTYSPVVCLLSQWRFLRATRIA